MCREDVHGLLVSVCLWLILSFPPPRLVTYWTEFWGDRSLTLKLNRASQNWNSLFQIYILSSSISATILCHTFGECEAVTLHWWKSGKLATKRLFLSTISQPSWNDRVSDFYWKFSFGQRSTCRCKNTYVLPIFRTMNIVSISSIRLSVLKLWVFPNEICISSDKTFSDFGGAIITWLQLNWTGFLISVTDSPLDQNASSPFLFRISTKQINRTRQEDGNDRTKRINIIDSPTHRWRLSFQVNTFPISITWSNLH